MLELSSYPIHTSLALTLSILLHAMAASRQLAMRIFYRQIKLNCHETNEEGIYSRTSFFSFWLAAYLPFFLFFLLDHVTNGAASLSHDGHSFSAILLRHAVLYRCSARAIVYRRR